MQHKSHMTLVAAHHDLSELSIPAGAAPKSQKAQKRARQKARKVGAQPANMDASEDAHGSGAMNGGGSGFVPGVVPRAAQPATAADTTFREVSQSLGTLAAANNSAECFVLVPSDAKSQGRHAWHLALACRVQVALARWECLLCTVLGKAWTWEGLRRPTQSISSYAAAGCGLCNTPAAAARPPSRL